MVSERPISARVARIRARGFRSEYQRTKIFRGIREAGGIPTPGAIFSDAVKVLEDLINIGRPGVEFTPVVDVDHTFRHHTVYRLNFGRGELYTGVAESKWRELYDFLVRRNEAGGYTVIVEASFTTPYPTYDAKGNEVFLTRGVRRLKAPGGASLYGREEFFNRYSNLQTIAEELTVMDLHRLDVLIIRSLN